MTASAPATVRRAAALVALQGALGVIGAVVFLVRAVGGVDGHIVNGFANAGWFVLFGAALLAAAWALWTGRRWGRGIAIFAQMLLLPVSWYVGVGSHRWVYAVPVAAVSLGVLVLLFAPATLRWMSYGSSSADNADNSAPDTR